MNCWGLAEDKAGMINQIRGLAEALGLEADLRLIKRRAPWKFLPASLWPDPLKAPAPGSDPLTPPWPDVVIGSGRYVAPILPAIKRASGGKTVTIYIQDPKMDPSRFDAVVVPEHDRCRADNVWTTVGALHRVTPERLREAAGEFEPQLAHLPRPLVAVLIGGSNGYYRFTPAVAERLADQMLKTCRESGAGLAITPSRRTDRDALDVLRRKLADAPAVIWDGQGPNPYFGFLGLADTILVTGESVSMVSEACSTGKPVYLIELEGKGGRKFNAFHRTLAERGCTRPFEGRLEQWHYEPLDDTRRVADAIRERFLTPR